MVKFILKKASDEGRELIGEDLSNLIGAANILDSLDLSLEKNSHVLVLVFPIEGNEALLEAKWNDELNDEDGDEVAAAVSFQERFGLAKERVKFIVAEIPCYVQSIAELGRPSYQFNAGEDFGFSATADNLSVRKNSFFYSSDPLKLVNLMSVYIFRD
jgi:hypothetical protein